MMGMLLALGSQRGRGERTKVGASHGKFRNLEARVVGRDCRRYKGGKCLYRVSGRGSRWGFQFQTYGIIFAHVVPLIEEGLLRLDLLEIAVGVAMDFCAVGCGGHTLMWAVELVVRLRVALGCVLGHGIVEEVVCRLLGEAMRGNVVGFLGAVWAIVIIWGELWGKLVLQVVDVE